MLFNSLDFALFLPVVFVLYWFVFARSLDRQNLLLLLASYVFYGWWDWRFLSLIALSTLVDYGVGMRLGKTSAPAKRKALLWVSIGANIGLLGFFKYYNFFVDSWVEAWASLGVTMQAATLHIILPVGISFYTFQTLSYTLDVYRNKIPPTRNLMQFAAFVSFFPQLVAGPIERAANLLPQFQRTRTFDSAFALSGVYLVVWGLFKKVVVADTCAFFVSAIFEAPEGYNSATLFLGAVLFAFQIYGDLSGYSDIAIGTARLFGFRLMTNFAFPYFSRDIAEFWRRWHISLSTWFRDYLYIPMGGSRGSRWLQLRNVFVVFLVSGFWHGANWTFMVWGGLHALLFLPLFVVQKHRTHVHTTHMRLRQAIAITFTFGMVTLAWVFFRADSIAIACTYLQRIFSFTGSSLHFFTGSAKSALFALIAGLSTGVMLCFEFKAVQKNAKEVNLTSVQAVFIAVLLIFMGMFKNPETFIYFQF